MAIRKLAAAAAFALIGSGAAVAADPIITYPTGGSAFDGFYAGVLGGIWDGNSVYFYGGALAGVNFPVHDMFVLGVEGRAVIYSDGDFGGDVAGRAGVLVSDDLLIFGDAGFGVRDGITHTFVGAGAEMVLADNMTVAGTVEFVDGSPYFTALRGDVSLRWHY